MRIICHISNREGLLSISNFWQLSPLPSIVNLVTNFPGLTRIIQKNMFSCFLCFFLLDPKCRVWPYGLRDPCMAQEPRRVSCFHSKLVPMSASGWRTTKPQWRTELVRSATTGWESMKKSLLIFFPLLLVLPARISVLFHGSGLLDMWNQSPGKKKGGHS